MKNTKRWNIALWIIQLLLAFVFIQAGATKIFNPDSLPYPWVKENPTLAIITGIVDLLGGLGLVLPALLRIQPRLVIYAAYGIIALMITAALFHISRGEGSVIGFNGVIILLAIFIAWGRRVKARFVSTE